MNINYHIYEKGTLFAERFEIIQLLGIGGMAYVYEVKDTFFSTKCALKILLPEMIDKKEGIERFKNETQVLRKLKHENIVSVQESGKFEKHYYFSMEYIAPMIQTHIRTNENYKIVQPLKKKSTKQFVIYLTSSNNRIDL